MKNSDMPAMPPPADYCQLWIDSKNPNKGVDDALGLTKREHFADSAMQGLCANSGYISEEWVELIAREAVRVADALLAELSK